MLLKHKTALLTGCNRGIGKEILKIFANNKSNLVCCVRQADEAFSNLINQLKIENNIKIDVYYIDFEKEKNIKEIASDIIKNHQINILVNNIGYLENSLFQMTTSQNLKKHFDVNFFSQFEFTQYIIKSMIKIKNGSIIFISSSASLDGNIGRSSYSSSKSAINGLSKVLSRELGRYNIRVNTIAPGLADTDMMRNTTDEKVLNDIVKNLSLRRIADPAEIANVVLFLASDLSSYLTGQLIRVDGGI